MLKLKTILFLCSILLVGSCGSGLEIEFRYTVGGSTDGLNGTVVLQNNKGDNISVTGSSFTFPTSLKNNSTYSVTVLTHPRAPDQTCIVFNGSDTIRGGNVTNVTVICTDVVPN